MSNANNEVFLASIYSVSEPGAVVRFLNILAEECKSKNELITELEKITDRLNQLDNDIKNDGKDISCFYDLTKQALTKIPFFVEEAVFVDNIVKRDMGEYDNLLLAQAMLVQDWYDELKPVVFPKTRELSEGLLLRLADDADVAQLRVLVNRSYAELGEMGLNFVGVTQDEAATRERMIDKEIWVIESIAEKKLLATMALGVKETEEKSMFYISQFGVLPEEKSKGLGSFLIHHAFRRAKARGYNIIELDTAIPAHHLVKLYRNFGFEIVEAERRPRPNYPNFLMDVDVREYEEQMKKLSGN